MRFFVLTVLIGLALATIATGAAASPQPTTATNGTATPNGTATTTPTASTTTTSGSETTAPTATPEPTETPRSQTATDSGGGGGVTVPDPNVNINVSVPDIGPNRSTATPTERPPPARESNTTRIDGATEIVGTRYIESDGIAMITIRSSATQTVTFSDAGRFNQGGKVPVRAEVFRSGETATVEIPITEVNGRVGVAITTENTPLYAAIIEDGGGGLEILEALSSLQAWAAGIIVAFTWMVIAGYSVLRREDGSPRRASI